MLLIRLDGMRLHVARETDLERDAPIVHVLRERLVLEQPRRVADAMRATQMHGLTHRRRIRALAGMTRARQVVLARIRKRRGVQPRRIAQLSACQIEAHDAALLVPHGELAPIPS